MRDFLSVPGDRSLISALLSFLYCTHISITYILALFSFFLTCAILDYFFIRVCFNICTKVCRYLGEEWVRRRLFITVLKYQPKSIHLNCLSLDARLFAKLRHLSLLRKGAKIEIATVGNEIPTQSSSGQAPSLRNRLQEVCPNVMHEMKCM